MTHSEPAIEGAAESITKAAVKASLKSVRRRSGAHPASDPLLQLEVVGARLRQRGLAATTERRAAMLGEILEELVTGGLRGARGIPAGEPLSRSRAVQAAMLKQDWTTGPRERRAWSCLYHYYVARDEPWQVKEIAAAVVPEARDADKPINRLLDDGYGLLAQRLATLSERGHHRNGVVAEEGVADEVPRVQHALPRSRKSFVGREQQVVELCHLLETAALVTLVGPGGSGKTRLAQAVAESASAQSGAAVAYVSLGAVPPPLATADANELKATEAGAVWQAVATSVGAADHAARSLEDAVVARLRHEEILLVLDNCEHLLRGAAVVADRLLAHLPAVKILATSRAPLRVDGEYVRAVHPLTLPAPDADFYATFAADAVQLFVDRAHQATDVFALDPTNAPQVGEICSLLAGVPLAIELAAARLATMSLPELWSSLSEGDYGVLDQGSVVNPRHETWFNAVGWGYGLLSPTEQAVFRALSTFSTPFTLAAAQYVCVGEAETSAPLEQRIVMLAETSILEVMPAEDAASTYRMIEVIREYGRGRLDESSAAAAVWSRFIRYHVELAERFAAPAEGAPLVTLEAMSDAYPNAVVALQRAIGLGRLDDGLRLATALWPYWWLRSHYVDALTLVTTLLEQPGAEKAGALYANGLRVAGNLAYMRYDMNAAARAYEAYLAHEAVLADPVLKAKGLQNLGLCYQKALDHERAVALMREAVALLRDHGSVHNLIDPTFNLANAARFFGQLGESRRAAEECAGYCRAVGDDAAAADAEHLVAAVAFDAGDLARARTFFQQSLAVLRDVGNESRAAEVEAYLARVACESGQFGEARQLLISSLGRAKALANPERQCGALQGWLLFATYQGDHGLARKYLAEYRRLAEEHQVDYNLRTLPFLEAEVALLGGDIATAGHFLRAAEPLRDVEIRNPELARYALIGPRVAIDQGDAIGADADLRTALAVYCSGGYRLLAAEALDDLAAIAARTGRPRRAVALDAAASALRRRLGAKRPPYFEARLAPWIEAARAELGEAAEAEAAAGRQMTFDDACRLALDEA